MAITYENVLVTCVDGSCSPQGQFMIHRLICPECENVIWIVGDETLVEKPAEELSIPDVKVEGNLTLHSHKCTCPDCGFVFNSGDKCHICGTGTSFYHLGDATFTYEEFQEMMAKKMNKCLVSREEYISNFKAHVNKITRIKELEAELTKIANEIRIKFEEKAILDAEKQTIIESAQNYEGHSLPIDLEVKMQISIDKYKQLDSDMKYLTETYESLKQELKAIKG